MSPPANLVLGRTPYLMSGALALVAAVAAALSFFFPTLLTGAPVATGCLRGTALVILLAGFPVLLAAMSRAARGSARGLVLWLGTLGFLAMFVLESISIATDQWFGSHADPLSSAASLSMVPAFAVVAVITALPLVWYCRNLDTAR